ncbi:hypothetical protein [Thermosynechococcus vestitus]|uniref:hypothetical protein n=1 Tax=Thermosynechococcus vestitus TaxID=146786 RepID=UPI0013E8B1AE|nr:hypothetical protein [Thermosynechococcus vestitus]
MSKETRQETTIKFPALGIELLKFDGQKVEFFGKEVLKFDGQKVEVLGGEVLKFDGQKVEVFRQEVLKFNEDDCLTRPLPDPSGNCDLQTPRESEEQSHQPEPVRVQASIALILQAKYAPSLKEKDVIQLNDLLRYIDKAAYYLVVRTQEIDNIEKNLSLGELDDKAYEQDIYLRIDIHPAIPEEICNAKSKLAITSFLQKHRNELEFKNFKNFKVSPLKLRLSSRGLEQFRS